MAALTDEVKAFIVRGLACFETPTEVARYVKEEFGIVVTASQVQAYDPTKRQGRSLSEKWRATFAADRAAFRAKVEEIPIANLAFRLQELTKLYRKATSQGNVVAASSLLEQAAKEVGGAFTNKQRHEVAGPNGAPVAVTQTTMTAEEFDARAKRLLDAY
ncbi:DUF2280 domain-containing protein [Paraburkholderia sp. Tr-20389]|uniref:DUF2280 domain-containing protein n=1 Tax=Paraburkholderia sp. Tr-20389 TaxID=2703903 RepID=UPI00197F1BFF|nr:DUF2280 domain-containing protein [Paraburkholderia sp. Tr-20389]MBN3755905.1 DUF2280 domain-containing protein [Paraburkholderia sp. Tr-20389]